MKQWSRYLLCFWVFLSVAACQGKDVKSLTIRQMFELEQAYLRDNPNIHKRDVSSSKVCYYKLGCFENTGVWSSRVLLSLLPASPQSVGLQFLLFTRTHRDRPEILDYSDPSTITKSTFDPSKRTVVVCHGFIESTSENWVKDINKELFTRDDINVINVNWGNFGGSKTLYTKATANTRMVGKALGVLIEQLIKTKSANAKSFHLTGHSLGAHIIGYAGYHMKTEVGASIARITGLDPAEPYFEEFGPMIRLDPTDAEFVDVIHSDGDSVYDIALGSIGGFGMMKSCGHADFYPNGGEEQPGCEKGLVAQITLEKSIYGGLRQYVACDHIRAIRYFNHSINACSFVGYQCPSADDFDTGACSASCGSGKCNEMGFHATKPTTNQKYFLYTEPSPPFCVNGYSLMKITLTADTAAMKGSMDVRLLDGGLRSSSTKTVTLDGFKTQFNIMVSWGFASSSVKYIELQWEETLPWWKAGTSLCRWATFCSGSKAGIQKAEVFDFKTKTRVEFCGGEVPEKPENGEGMRLLPSDYC